MCASTKSERIKEIEEEIKIIEEDLLSIDINIDFYEELYKRYKNKDDKLYLVELKKLKKKMEEYLSKLLRELEE